MPDETRDRIFTFGEAESLLQEILPLTEQAYLRIEDVRSRAAAGATPSEDLQAEAHAIVADWAEAVKERGAEVKGLWLVDFDNGSGYYCWRYPETRLEYYHSYDDGFGGRMRIH
jgi:hypothetical protein